MYSAGVSTLSASYNALTTLTIEDVVKVFHKKYYNGQRKLKDDVYIKLFKVLRKLLFDLLTILKFNKQVNKHNIIAFLFATISIIFAAILNIFDSSFILQVNCY